MMINSGYISKKFQPWFSMGNVEVTALDTLTKYEVEIRDIERQHHGVRSFLQLWSSATFLLTTTKSSLSSDFSCISRKARNSLTWNKINHFPQYKCMLVQGPSKNSFKGCGAVQRQWIPHLWLRRIKYICTFFGDWWRDGCNLPFRVPLASSSSSQGCKRMILRSWVRSNASAWGTAEARCRRRGSCWERLTRSRRCSRPRGWREACACRTTLPRNRGTGGRSWGHWRHSCPGREATCAGWSTCPGRAVFDGGLNKVPSTVTIIVRELIAKYRLRDSRLMATAGGKFIQPSISLLCFV